MRCGWKVSWQGFKEDNEDGVVDEKGPIGGRVRTAVDGCERREESVRGQASWIRSNGRAKARAWSK
jgi:hypothetical protein